MWKHTVVAANNDAERLGIYSCHLVLWGWGGWRDGSEGKAFEFECWTVELDSK